MAMAGAKFAKQMEKVGIDVRGCQVVFGCSRRTVFSWRSETAPVPRAVALLSLALEAGYIDPGWIMDKIEKNVV